jgi:hypothetical protein
LPQGKGKGNPKIKEYGIFGRGIGVSDFRIVQNLQKHPNLIIFKSSEFPKGRNFHKSNTLELEKFQQTLNYLNLSLAV